MKWSHATVLVGILSVLSMPWLLVTPESATGLGLFVKIYSAFLGPIFAVMAVDYYILRKQCLDINMMYDKEGPFKGINWAAMLAIIIGSASSLLFVQLSWYVSLLPSGIAYYLLMKYLPASASFRKGSIFDK